MNITRAFFLLVVSGLLLLQTGCVRVATAPRRAAAQERANNTLARLAAIDPQQLADFETRRMIERLGLTTVQQPTIAALNLRYTQRMRAIAAAPGDPRERFRDLRTAEAEKDGELSAILTPDQMRIYQQVKVEWRETIRDRFGA